MGAGVLALSRGRERSQAGTYAPPAAIDPEILSALVGSIYDAAIAPERWAGVLDQCRGFVGGFSASIFAKDTAGVAGGIFHTDGRVTPYYASLYFERYARLDPTTGAHLLAPLEQLISNADIMELDEFHATRFYREWAEPQGLVDCIMAPLEKRGNWGALFGVMRDAAAGMADDDAKSRMSLLVPHIRRAVLIGRVIEQQSFEAASFADALDGLAAGMFLVDAGCRVVHANQSARLMLRRGGPLEDREGQLAARTQAASAALLASVTSAASGDAALGGKGVGLAFQDGAGENYAAHILPLTSGNRRRTGIHYDAVAAVFVQRATLDVPEMPETIARTYELTLTELRVMMTVATGGGVQETAEALGIAESTVKTHLHRVFAKTGTARQADLVRLVAGFASPLATSG